MALFQFSSCFKKYIIETSPVGMVPGIVLSFSSMRRVYIAMETGEQLG